MITKRRLDQPDDGRRQWPLTPAQEPLGKTTWSKLAINAKQLAQTCRNHNMRTQPKAYFSHRDVEVIAYDKRDGRLGDPEFIAYGDLKGATLARAVEHLHKQFPNADGINIDGGVDAWDSLNDYLHKADGFDYEPCVDAWSLEVPMTFVREQFWEGFKQKEPTP